MSHLQGATATPSNRITANQPLQQVTNTGGIGFAGARNVSNIPLPNRAAQLGGRAFVEQIDFAEGWQANNVRITNDPAELNCAGR